MSCRTPTAPRKLPKLVTSHPAAMFSRSPAKEPHQAKDISTPTKTTEDDVEFCVCASSGKCKVYEEELIRCGNPKCDPGWYHLECVELPDHPPRRLCWLCPACCDELRPRAHVNGLINLKYPEKTRVMAKAWLAEVKREVAERRKAQEARKAKKQKMRAETKKRAEAEK